MSRGRRAPCNPPRHCASPPRAARASASRHDPSPSGRWLRQMDRTRPRRQPQSRRSAHAHAPRHSRLRPGHHFDRRRIRTYSFINIPYSSMLGVISPSPCIRTLASRYQVGSTHGWLRTTDDQGLAQIATTTPSTSPSTRRLGRPAQRLPASAQRHAPRRRHRFPLPRRPRAKRPHLHALRRQGLVPCLSSGARVRTRPASAPPSTSP